MTETIIPAAANETGEQGFDLREALSFVWRQWKFVIVITVLVCTVGMVMVLQQTPVYTASSQILLDPQQQRAPGGEIGLPQVTLNLSMLQSQMAIIRSTDFLRRIVERNHLASDPALGGGLASSRLVQTSPTLWSEITSFFSSLLPSSLSFAASAPPDESDPALNPPPASPGSDGIPVAELPAIRALSSSLKVSRAEDSGSVLTISVTSSDPASAARLTNAVADAYLVDKLDARFEATKRASAWLGDQLVALQDQLHESEVAVEDFRAQNGLVQSSSGVTLTQQQLADLNNNLVGAKADLAQKKAQVDLLNSIAAKGGSLQDMPSIASGGALESLRQQVSELSKQQAQLLTRYDPSYPLIVNVQAQLRDINRSIAAETNRLAAGIRNDYALAQARVASLETSLRQATGQTNLDDATAIRLHELERTAEVNRTLFEDFLKQAKITQADATFEPQDARIITPALMPGQPSAPNKTRFMSMTLIIGLLSGVGGAFAKEKLRVGFTTPKEVEDQLGLPVLASVTHLPARDRKGDAGALPVHEVPINKPLGRYSEAIRSLRSGIHMTDVDHPPKVIQVTSAAPSEGKTTIALSLAASAAMAKLKVLVIDADLRHPTATRAFGLQKAAGLVDLLLGEVSVTDVLKYQESGKYWVLGAGNKTQNPTDLLGSERMKAMVAGFKQSYDLVIIDTPPAGPVIDPVVVAQLADKIVFVVRWGKTARELVKQSVEQFSGHRKLAGVAFNMVNEKEAQKYGKYAYSYYYGTRYYKNYYAE